MPRVNPVKPVRFPQTYTNPASQGTLIKQTAGWKNGNLAAGHAVSSSYVDAMWGIPAKWDAFIKAMRIGDEQRSYGLNTLVSRATDDGLIAAAKLYFELDVVAVRWVYYFNQATGYDSQRVDIIYSIHDLSS